MIFVTGGAGFIGSNIVKGLNDKGILDIVIVDNIADGDKYLNLNGLVFTDFIQKHDFITMLDKLKGERIDAFFHMGACSSTIEKNGHYMIQNNYEYSKKLLHFCLENKIKFIYASSASVYGNGDNGFREDICCEKPLNLYAFSKYLFDQYVRKLLLPSGCQVVGLRYFNVYGPNENHKMNMASVFYHFYQQILKENKLKLFEGSDNFKRDFIFVKDIVAINLFFLETCSHSGIFNCGTGTAESFTKIANLMLDSFSSAQIEYIPFPDVLRGKYQNYTCAQIDNLTNAGYNNAFTSIEDGTKIYLQQLIENN